MTAPVVSEQMESHHLSCYSVSDLLGLLLILSFFSHNLDTTVTAKEYMERIHGKNSRETVMHAMAGLSPFHSMHSPSSLSSSRRKKSLHVMPSFKVFLPVLSGLPASNERKVCLEYRLKVSNKPLLHTKQVSEATTRQIYSSAQTRRRDQKEKKSLP